MISLNERRRIIIDKKIGKAQWPSLFHRAAGNNYNTLIIPLRNIFFYMKKSRGLFLKTAERNNMAIEAGGHDLSFFMPRRLFFLHRDLFRMDWGRRRLKFNFCPTSPKTIEYLKKRADKFFRKLIPALAPDSVPVFHLWPDRGEEKTWCSCPACRAFTPAEQYRIAVNSIADVLANISPAARISCLDLSENSGDEPAAAKNGSGFTGIRARDNTFVLESVPPCFLGK